MAPTNVLFLVKVLGLSVGVYVWVHLKVVVVFVNFYFGGHMCTEI